MKRFIVLAFVFMGLGFYEISGGGDFDPLDTRAALIDARQTRDEVRIAALGSVDLYKSDLAQNDTTVTRSVDTQENSDVTRAALNLVSFEAAKQPESTPIPEVKAEPVQDLSELAAQEELSLASLERTSALRPDNTFSGNSVVSTPSGTAGFEQDIRTVKGTRVNMRSGPGTEYDVIDQLVQATRVEILTDTGNGWVELRPIDGGPTGWIAEFLLTGG